MQVHVSELIAHRLDDGRCHSLLSLATEFLYPSWPLMTARWKLRSLLCID